MTVYGDDNAIYSPGAGGTEYRILGDPIFSQTITFTSAANVITVTFPASCHYFAVSRPTEGVLYLESAVIKTDIAADANDWATAFLDATSVCDPTGATNNIDDDLWLDQRYAYTCLSSKAQAFIHDPEALSDATQKQNVMNALARYRYILSKYGTEMYENFLGLSLGPSISEANRASSGDWTGGIALFGLVGIGAGSLLLLAKRRKKE